MPEAVSISPINTTIYFHGEGGGFLADKVKGVNLASVSHTVGRWYYATFS